MFIYILQVLRVKAVDGDRGVNNEINYKIVSGPSDLFGITPESGIVFTQASLDRESQRSANGAYILGIRAQEVGGSNSEDAYVDTEVTIMIEVGKLLLKEETTFLQNFISWEKILTLWWKNHKIETKKRQNI